MLNPLRDKMTSMRDKMASMRDKMTPMKACAGGGGGKELETNSKRYTIKKKKKKCASSGAQQPQHLSVKLLRPHPFLSPSRPFPSRSFSVGHCIFFVGNFLYLFFVGQPGFGDGGRLSAAAPHGAPFHLRSNLGAAADVAHGFERHVAAAAVRLAGHRTRPGPKTCQL